MMVLDVALGRNISVWITNERKRSFPFKIAYESYFILFNFVSNLFWRKAQNLKS
jgi:hypothetical protein